MLSCSLDEGSNSYLKTIPIETASMPEYFQYGQVYQINLTYLKTSSCYSFNDVYSVKNDNTITFAVINSVTDNGNCQTISQEIEKSFDFTASDIGTYIFKFWQGEDNNGEDVYLIMEIPVEQ